MAAAKPTGAAIRDDETYPLPDFKQISGLGDKSIAKLRRAGLKVHTAGRRAYIVGREFREVLQKTAKV